MIDQVAIFMTGIVAVWLSQDEKPERRKYACLFALVGQPFWFYASYQASQWGVMILSIFYTIAWAKGFYLYWIKPHKQSRLRTTK
jgi:nicotinamide riboside transporter PnuC